MRSFAFGDGRRKVFLYLAPWICKHDGRRLCPCCQPKGALPPAIPSHPAWREYFNPNETGKTRMPRRR